MGSQDEMTAWTNARIVTCDEKRGELGLIERGTLVVRDGHIVMIGPDSDFLETSTITNVIDCDGRLITPGLIDCHTHLVHAGNRAHEFEMRLAGATYEEIARAGGGIISSVKALRAASADDLIRESLPRLEALMAEGVTTVEIKSGYGLDTENELKSLRAARRLGEMRDVGVHTTFLGAHALPPEMKYDRAGYVIKIIDEMLPIIAQAGLADAVDGFCEGIAFSPDEITRIFEKARALGLPVKLHADQLSNLHGAALAAKHGALSADHLEYTDEDSAQAMARSGTVAVLLPGAFYFIRETRKPPVDLFRKHGVPLALATDNNPGTSPLTSPLLTMNMGATLYGMTIEECVKAMTVHAAKALGIHDETGSLERGKWADFAVWNTREPAELVYRMGFNPLHARIRHGRITAKEQ